MLFGYKKKRALCPSSFLIPTDIPPPHFCSSTTCSPCYRDMQAFLFRRSFFFFFRASESRRLSSSSFVGYPFPPARAPPACCLCVSCPLSSATVPTLSLPYPRISRPWKRDVFLGVVLRVDCPRFFPPHLRQRPTARHGAARHAGRLTEAVL